VVVVDHIIQSNHLDMWNPSLRSHTQICSCNEVQTKTRITETSRPEEIINVEMSNLHPNLEFDNRRIKSDDYNHLVFKTSSFPVPELPQELVVSWVDDLLFSGQDLIDLFKLSTTKTTNAFQIKIDPKMYYVRGCIEPSPLPFSKWITMIIPQTEFWTFRQRQCDINAHIGTTKSCKLAEILERNHDEFRWLRLVSVNTSDTSCEEWEKNVFKSVYNNIIKNKLSFDITKIPTTSCNGMLIPAFQVMDRSTLEARIKTYHDAVDLANFNVRKYSLIQ
jgi:hypothetical protein